MQTIQELIQFLLQQDRSIVFGNLGRYPQLLIETLLSIPSLRVLIVSKRPCISTDDRIRVQRPNDPLERCDLLIYLEPSPVQFIETPIRSTRVVVFTSHFTYMLPLGDVWIHICYFHGKDLSATRDLLQVQDFSIQTSNIGLVEADHINVLVLSEGRTAPRQAHTYVIVDLTRFTSDIFDLYLAYWDAFDFVLEHRALIDRWVVCFSEHGHQHFRRFAQKVIDDVFCHTFEYGNVTEHRDIVSLFPFYRSGTIDRHFQVTTSSFGDIPVALPKTIEEACQVAALYNTSPFVKNVLWISE